MRSAAKFAAMIVAAVSCVGLGSILGGSLNISWRGELAINPVELVTIILTALSVMLAILTIFLAVFAFVGISAINEKLREHSMNYFTNELQDGRPAFDLLRRVVRNIVYEGIDPITDEENPTSNGVETSNEVD